MYSKSNVEYADRIGPSFTDVLMNLVINGKLKEELKRQILKVTSVYYKDS